MDSSVLERRPVAYLDVIIRDGDRQGEYSRTLLLYERQMLMAP